MLDPLPHSLRVCVCVKECDAICAAKLPLDTPRKKMSSDHVVVSFVPPPQKSRSSAATRFKPIAPALPPPPSSSAPRTTTTTTTNRTCASLSSLCLEALTRLLPYDVGQEDVTDIPDHCIEECYSEHVQSVSEFVTIFRRFPSYRKRDVIHACRERVVTKQWKERTPVHLQLDLSGVKNHEITCVDYNPAFGKIVVGTRNGSVICFSATPTKQGTLKQDYTLYVSDSNTNQDARNKHRERQRRRAHGVNGCFHPSDLWMYDESLKDTPKRPPRMWLPEVAPPQFSVSIGEKRKRVENANYEHAHQHCNGVGVDDNEGSNTPGRYKRRKHHFQRAYRRATHMSSTDEDMLSSGGSSVFSGGAYSIEKRMQEQWGMHQFDDSGSMWSCSQATSAASGGEWSPSQGACLWEDAASGCERASKRARLYDSSTGDMQMVCVDEQFSSSVSTSPCSSSRKKRDESANSSSGGDSIYFSMREEQTSFKLSRAPIEEKRRRLRRLNKRKERRKMQKRGSDSIRFARIVKENTVVAVCVKGFVHRWMWGEEAQCSYERKGPYTMLTESASEIRAMDESKVLAMSRYDGSLVIHHYGFSSRSSTYHVTYKSLFSQKNQHDGGSGGGSGVSAASALMQNDAFLMSEGRVGICIKPLGVSVIGPDMQKTMYVENTLSSHEFAGYAAFLTLEGNLYVKDIETEHMVAQTSLKWLRNRVTSTPSSSFSCRPDLDGNVPRKSAVSNVRLISQTRAIVWDDTIVYMYAWSEVVCHDAVPMQMSLIHTIASPQPPMYRAVIKDVFASEFVIGIVNAVERTVGMKDEEFDPKFQMHAFYFDCEDYGNMVRVNALHNK